MIFVFHIVGDINKIIDANKLDQNNLIIKKIEEKQLAKPGYLKSCLGEQSFESIIFATDDLSYQRFQIFIKLYILIYFFSLSGNIIDQYGTQNKFSILKLFFIEIPLLISEAVVTLFTIIIWNIRINRIWNQIKN